MPLQSSRLRVVDSLCDHTAPASGRAETAVVSAAGWDIVSLFVRNIIVPIGRRRPFQAIDVARLWFPVQRKKNDQVEGSAVRSISVWWLRGIHRAPVPASSDRSTPFDVSGTASLTGAAARRSCSALSRLVYRTCRSGCPVAPRPRGRGASTSVSRPGLRRLGRGGHLG